MARYIDAEQFRGKHEVTEVNGKLNSVILYSDIVYAPAADVVPRSEVERLLEDFQRSIRADAKVGMSAGEILLHINNMLAELKKKYTEERK